MSPDFAKVVDPLLVQLMDVGDKARTRTFTELTNELTTAIDQVESKLGASLEWEYAKYAIVCWVDAQIINEKPKWKDEILESYYFKSGIGHAEFFKRAEKAYRDKCFDATEVFYLCFLFGFRGIYLEDEPSLIPRDLPTSGADWQKQTARRLSGVQYKPPTQWDSTTSIRANRNEITGMSSLINMGLLFMFSLVLLGLSFLIPFVMRLIGS